MTARLFEIATLLIPPPSAGPSVNPGFAPQNLSYTLEDSDTIQTLSSTIGGYSLQGFLFVPEIDRIDADCAQKATNYVPRNVTRIDKRSPIAQYTDSHIAFAPWFEVNCTRAYLAAADPLSISAFVFYHPDNSTGGAYGSPNSGGWSLNDAGQWKNQHNYPVYTVSGQEGQQIMTALSQYSGNLSQAPYATDLAKLFSPDHTPRLYSRVQIMSSSSNLPSLWVFLIIVLGILLLTVMGTSFILHIVQRKHRKDLRRRVAAGEVDLEILGIKRLNVPQDVLDKMPLYIYSSKDAPATTSRPLAATSLPSTSVSKVGGKDPDTKVSKIKDVFKHPTLAAPAKPRQTPFNQPTCPVCLDDFENHTTIVRELPCQHIFHPECIDVFLRDHSSLCPMCKKSVLPTGYCPDIITNAMVRRERMIRRARAAPGVPLTLEDGTVIQTHPPANRFQRRLSSLGGWVESHRGNPTRPYQSPTSIANRHASQAAALQRYNQQNSTAENAAASTAAETPATELTTIPTNVSATRGVLHADMPPEIASADATTRREWAARRLAEENPDVGQSAQELERREEERMPAWRRPFRRLFPTNAVS